MRAHWEWAGRHAMFWIFVTLIIFGGFFLLFDYVGADDSVRTQCLVLLGTITVVNTIWRAVGLLAARIELMHLTRDGRDNRVSPFTTRTFRDVRIPVAIRCKADL